MAEQGEQPGNHSSNAPVLTSTSFLTATPLPAFQGSLLRLVILCSTGLSSFASTDEGDGSSSSLIILPRNTSPPPHTHFTTLRTQLRSDAFALFGEAAKKATNLSLALKKSAKAKAASSDASSSTLSPLSGLDAASVTAAQQQIDAFTNDVLPKLFFIWSKAQKEQAVYVEEGDEADAAAAAASTSKPAVENDAKAQSRRELEELARSMGASVLSASELGLDSKKERKLRKLPGLGVGSTWTRALRSHVQAVSTAIAGLGESCMDERTKKAVGAAQRARQRREGGALISVGDDDKKATATPKTAEALRSQCLARTAAVWEACDDASKTLPLDNVSAVRTRWAQRRALMEDGEREMSEEAREQSSSTPSDPSADDEFGLSSLSLLDERDRALLGKVLPLIRLGRLLHDRAGELCLTDEEAKRIDVDELDERGEDLAQMQDDLVAAVLYDERPQTDSLSEEPDTSGDGSWDRSTVAVEYLEAAQALVEATGSKQKAVVAVEEMRKLYEGIPAAEWIGRGEGSGEDDDEDEDGDEDEE